jgi:arylsulfatase
LPLLEGDRVVAYNDNLEDQGKLTGTLTKKAVDFISSHKNEPFFLYLAQPMPHVPLAASAAFRGKSEQGLFGDVVMELDWSVGQIMKRLDELKLSENTILIITSDNGPWLNYGDHAGSSGGLREGKGTAWDGGTRVPCIIRWPGKIAAGSVNSQLMVNIDLLPTIVSITKAALPKNRIDGMDFSSLLTGKTEQGPRTVFYYYYDVNNLKAVRYQNWKLVFPHSSRTYTAGLPGKNGYPGPAPDAPVKMALYNLSHDPGEQYDVQASYPEIVKKIEGYAEEARQDLGDDLTKRIGANRRPAGKVN